MGNFAFRPRDKAALDWVDDCVEQAHNYRKQFEPQWHENWSNYRVESFFNVQYPDKQYPMSTGGVNRFEMSPINFIKTPESHQGVNTLRALLLASLFGTRDFVQADPIGNADVDAARNVSKLIMYGLERPGNFRTNFETVGDCLIFGLGSYSSRWRTDVKLVPRRLPVPDPSGLSPFLIDPNTGQPVTVMRQVMVPTFDDPVLETDDLFDTWFDPAANRFGELKWKVKRFRIRDEELLDLQNDPNWDASGIAQVLTQDPSERVTGPDATTHPKLVTENLTLEDVKEIKDYGYYGGWYFEGMVPKEIADQIGGIDPRGAVVLRIINGTIVQAIQSPQRNGDIQGGTLTILPTGRGIYGLSPLTVVRYLQDVSDTQMILTVQALIESVYQNYLVGGDLGPTFARDLETRRPREALTLQGEVTQVVPLPKDYAGLGIAVQALSLISQTMRNAMNARDPVQGIVKQGGEAETATAAQITATSALQNTDQIAVLMERDELPQMGRTINDLYYVNLDDEGKVFRRTGETDMTTVNYFDIDAVNPHINFVGARNVLNKRAKANQFRDYIGLMVSNPLTAASLDWHKVTKFYGDECLDIKGLDQLTITDPEEIIARMQAPGLPGLIGSAVKTAGPAATASPSGGAPAKKGRANPGNGGNTGGLMDMQTQGELS